MKARKVKGLDPEGTLLENACRIAEVRLDELYGFAPRALDPDEVVALHDMRIAAKRLRYVFEVTEPALGRLAADGAREAKKLQDVLGEIHDCDELTPRVAQQIERLRAEDVAAGLAGEREGAKDLDPAAVREVPNRNRYRGLELLTVYLGARRAHLHGRFLAHWQQLQDEGFRDWVESGLAARVRSEAERVP
jgi:CHAD domain